MYYLYINYSYLEVVGGELVVADLLLGLALLLVAVAALLLHHHALLLSLVCAHQAHWFLQYWCWNMYSSSSSIGYSV